jgi:hypothetical protein
LTSPVDVSSPAESSGESRVPDSKKFSLLAVRPFLLSLQVTVPIAVVVNDSEPQLSVATC